MLETIIKLLKRFRNGKRGVSNVIVVMLSLILIVIIVGNVVLWSYQMNQLDWEKMKENINITNVERINRSSWFVTQSEYTVNDGSYISGSYTDTQTVDSQYERFTEALATPLYYPNGYSVLYGTYLSGAVPGSVQTVDSDYFVVRSSGTATSTATHNPLDSNLFGGTTLVSGTTVDLVSNNEVYMTFRSYFSGTATSYNPYGYNPWGSTIPASGTVSNLASDDGSYMIFKSYPSSFSATSETLATIGYRSNTDTNMLNSPKNRAWNGTAWLSENEMATAGSPIRFVRVAYSSLGARYYEKIIVTLSDDGNLDAYSWMGSSWNVANNIASVGTTANAYRPFDIEYEKTTGRALLVYFTNAANEIGYKIWNGTAWSGESTYDLVSAASVRVYWISLAQNPISSSNELALVCIDATNSDAYALIWNGSSWGDKRILTTSITTTATEDVTVVYEQISGYAHFAYSIGNDAHVVRRTGPGTYTDYAVDLTGSGSPTMFSMKADPTSNRIMLGALDTTSKLYTADWNGAAWALHGVHDNNTDYDQYRDFDIAWEPTGSKALIVWAGWWGSLRYKTWTSGSGWSGESGIAMAGGHPWVQLRTNPRSAGPKILGATLDTNFDLGSLKWDGATLTGTSGAFTTDTTVITYESFEIEFQKFGDPIEFTSEVEFTGTSNTNIWSQLAWAVDTAWDTANVAVTIQLYDWNTLSYPTSGDGYITYTSSATPNTDETKTQTITNNPQNYRSANGNWKIKVKGVKSTTAQFQFKADWVEYKPTRAEYTSEVEFTGTSNTASWTQLVWTVDSAWTTGTVTVSLQLYNYTLGAYPTSGNGFISYTSSATANTDETKTQTITMNPSHFRDGSGNWKMKVKGVKTTTTQFDFKADWIEFKTTYYNEYTASTEFTFSNMKTKIPTQLNFTVISEYNIANVSVTIQVWNYSSSAYVTSGEGYLAYTSGGSNETKLLSININPQFYTSNGNAKIKITGVKSTTLQYLQKINHIKLYYKIENRLDINGVYVIDLSTYSLAYIQSVEIQLRYRASDSGEKWYLKAYNWTGATYSDIGFNSTTGHMPTTGWDYYSVNLTTIWNSYVWNNGTIYVQFIDQGQDSISTTIDIDFLGVRAVIDGTRFSFKNEGASTSHLISLWVNNATNHQRYDINLFVNSGENVIYVRLDMSLPMGNFVVRVVTEKGNVAVFARH